MPPKNQIKPDLINLMDGAVNERFQNALAQVSDNINDPNTDAKATRCITLKIKFKPNEQRNVIQTLVSCDVALASAESLETTTIMEADNNGVLGLFELGAGLRHDQHTLPMGGEEPQAQHPKVSNLHGKK